MNQDLNQNESKIIRVIKKLFALAGNNPNENEAASALARANELLIENNLSQATIDAAKLEDASCNDVIDNKVEIVSRYQWRRLLAHIIARHNFCRAIWCGRRGRGYILFVGRKTNVEVTTQMYEWMALQVEHLLLAGMNVEETHTDAFQYGKMVWISSFTHGMIIRLKERLEAIKFRMEPTVKTACSALVVQTDQEIRKFFLGRGERITTSRLHHRNSDPDAYAAGKRHGDKLQVDPQVERTSRKNQPALGYQR